MDFEDTLISTPASRWRTRQAVVFDWYDGPREGVCALAVPECEFYFELLDERTNPDDLDDRLFRASALPSGSLDRLLAGLRDLGSPTNSVWVPMWRFPNDGARRQATDLVEALRSARRPTAVVIATRDMMQFLGCWQVSRPEASVTDWFAYLASAPSVAG